MMRTDPIETDVDAAGTPSQLPFLLFCVYTFILIGRPQDYLPSLAPLRLGLLLTVLTSIVTFVNRADNPGGSIFRHRETKAFVFLFVVMCAEIPFSIYRRASFEFVFYRYIVNLVFFLLFVVHVNTVERFRRIIFIVAASAMLFSAMGLLEGHFEDGRYLTGSDMFDPNDVAFVEVSFLAFSLSILFGAYGLIIRGLAGLTVATGVLLALYTGSRGGVLGLATVFLLFLLLPVERVKKGHKGLLLVAVAVVAVLSADKLNMDRYRTLTAIDEDYNASDEFGRAQIWRRGLDMFWENPLTGVGPDMFGQALAESRERDNVRPQYQTSHNSYVEVLSECGIFGIGAFLVLIFTSLVTFNRFRRGIEPGLPRELQSIAGLLLIGFCGQVVGGSFLSQAYAMPFTLSFAASAALKGLERAPAADAAVSESFAA